MNVCFITECSLPVPTTQGGAVETLVEYIIDENEKKGKYQISVISIEDKKAIEQAKKYKFVNFVFVKKGNEFVDKVLDFFARKIAHINIYLPRSMAFRRAKKCLKDLPKQDVYIYEAGPTTYLPILERIIPKEKLIVHLHWRGMGDKKKDTCFEYLMPVSNYIATQWTDKTGREHDKIKPLYNCARIQRFAKECSDEEKKQLKRELNISENKKIIIYTGRIVPEKGVKELIEAVLMLKREDVVLLIVGSANFGKKSNTKFENEIRKYIDQLKDCIKFTGFIHQTDLYKYYNIADVAVVPSLFPDPAPLVGIEAQAAGMPLIATNIGGIPEYTCKEGTILIEKNDDFVENLSIEIAKLLDSEELRKKMGTIAKKHALKFDTQMYFNQFEKIIDEIIGGETI